ncbi:NADP-dependent oxidoreductase [Nocardiopsis aegyptia]|uniref:NADPH:quinone reductase-like Zn-dependent oxidoreductase n=1 Tax=Nocardiopsis aegyptia TaxID=220378 RepID=A0A7Z0EJ16_9ACTN|nr:NADP-dependent oxidoreductase [Nocardiopsis aegyptia]NYJ33007.1 NADPH:quinone reductase-like Zn-dependent oxidoreductase [Nocardiopsis aegyptia]
MTEQMRIVQQRTLGGPEVLEVARVPVPDLGATRILVRVHAAGVNPVDWKLRQHGYWLTPPFSQGFDVSGVVVAVSQGSSRFAVGDEVYGMPNYPDVPDAYADYVAAPARRFSRKPVGLDHTEAAALPLASLTAWQALVDTAAVAAGQRVLVHAAAGGVGHLAVQIAKARGAHVIGTASAAKHTMLRELGADELVDYTSTDFTETVGRVDVVLDPIGGDYLERSLRVLRPDGWYVGVSNPLEQETIVEAADAAGVRGATVCVEPDHVQLDGITALAEAGKLRPVVSETFPLEAAAKAHEHSQTGRTAGKVVLTMT